MKKKILILVLILSLFSVNAYETEYKTLENVMEFRQAIDSSQFASLEAYNQYTVPKKDGIVNLLDYLGYSAGIRNQGHFGNCWVWSSTLNTELALSIEYGVQDRLSIQYFDSNYKEIVTNEENADGGWYYWFSDVVNIIGKVIPWDNENADYADYYGDSDLSSSEIQDDVYYPINMDFARIKTNGVSSEKVISDIKYYLDHGKVVGFAFFLPDSEDWNQFYDFWMYNSSTDVLNYDNIIENNTITSGMGGHAINIVGYNDIERYWIVENSWGDYGGRRPNGTFRMSFDMDYDLRDTMDEWNAFYFWIHTYEFGSEKGLRVEPEVDSKINIDKVVFDKKVVSAGDVITTSTKVSNDYEYMNLQNVKVSYYIPKLGLKRSVGPFDIEMFEDVMKRVYVDIPKSASAGVYDVRIVLQTEDTKEVRYEEIEVK